MIAEPCDCDLPADRTHGDRHTVGGDEWVTLADADDQYLVPAPVVDYQGRGDHPLTAGAAALVALAAAVAVPLAVGYCATTCWGLTTTPAGTYLVGLLAAGAAVAAFNRLLWHTRVGEWIAWFGYWLDVRHILALEGDV